MKPGFASARHGALGAVGGLMVAIFASCGAETPAPAPAPAADQPGANGAGGTAPTAGSTGRGTGGQTGSSTATGGSGGAGTIAGGGPEGGTGPGADNAGSGPSSDAGVKDAPGASADAIVFSGDGAPVKLPDLPGLVLWLDAEKNVTVAAGKVAKWDDLSGKANHAFMDTAMYQPTLVMASNGHPAIHFTGKRDPKNGAGDGGPYLRIKDSPTMNWGTSDFTILIVGSYENATDGTHNGAFGTWYGKYGKPEILFTGNWMISETVERSYLHINFGEGVGGMDGKRQMLNDGKIRIYAMRRTGTGLELRINGEVDRKGGGGGANVSSPGIDVGIGSFSGKQSIRCLKGDLQVVLAVQGPLSDANLTSLEGYLKNRFNPAP